MTQGAAVKGAPHVGRLAKHGERAAAWVVVAGIAFSVGCAPRVSEGTTTVVERGDRAYPGAPSETPLGPSSEPDAAPVSSARGPGLVHWPSDTPEPLIVRRKEAWALAESGPEAGDVSILPILVSYIQDPDAEVRWAGEVSITRIAMSEEAVESGLRAAVRDEGTITSTLFANVGYESLDTLDSKVRAQAVDSIRDLYLEVPTALIEQSMLNRYWIEAFPNVRKSIVVLLCEHGYTSAGTVDVLVDASQDTDEVIAEIAASCLAAMGR